MAAPFITRRRRFSGVLVVALLALAVGVSQGLAGSRGNGSATTLIQYHNDLCGRDSGKKVIGTAQLTLKGNTLTVHVKLHGADPGQYVLHVHAGLPSCDLVKAFDKFTVDASGDGEGSGSVDVSGYGRSFFAEARGVSLGFSNDSVTVKL